MTDYWGEAFHVLRECGVELLDARGHDVTLRTSLADELPFRIVGGGAHEPSAALDRAIATRGTGALPLYIVRRSTLRLREAALDRQIGLISLSERICIVDGYQLPPPPRAVGNASYRLCALARLLLSSQGPWRQGPPLGRRAVTQMLPVSLASRLGVAQSRVSTLMRELPLGSVEAGRDGCRVTDFVQLWNWHLAEYRGPWVVADELKHTRLRASQLEEGTRLLKRAAGRYASRRLDGKAPDRPVISGIEAMPLPALTDPSARTRSAPGGSPVTILSETLATMPASERYIPCQPWVSTLRLAQIADPYVRITAEAWGAPERTDPVVTAWVLEEEKDRLRLRDWAQSRRADSPRLIV